MLEYVYNQFSGLYVDTLKRMLKLSVLEAHLYCLGYNDSKVFL